MHVFPIPGGKVLGFLRIERSGVPFGLKELDDPLLEPIGPTWRVSKHSLAERARNWGWELDETCPVAQKWKRFLAANDGGVNGTLVEMSGERVSSSSVVKKAGEFGIPESTLSDGDPEQVSCLVAFVSSTRTCNWRLDVVLTFFSSRLIGWSDLTGVTVNRDICNGREVEFYK